jgi:hypothetical protein
MNSGIDLAMSWSVFSGLLQKSAHLELVNRQIQFRVRDIYYPDPQAVMSKLYGDCVLEGQVLDITEGDQGARFAVVKVIGLNDPVVIAIERITNLV